MSDEDARNSRVLKHLWVVPLKITSRPGSGGSELVDTHILRHLPVVKILCFPERIVTRPECPTICVKLIAEH